MSIFNSKINKAFDAFNSKKYSMACTALKEAYQLLCSSKTEIAPSPYFISKSLIIIEELLEIPEIELTDYLVGIVATEKATLANSNYNIFGYHTKTYGQLIDILTDLESVIQYWDEYLGGMNTHPKPSITVGIESKGQYSFYENIYEPRSMKQP